MGRRRLVQTPRLGNPVRDHVVNRSISGQSRCVKGELLLHLVRDSLVMTGAGGGAGPGDRPGRRWDVALSFAGAQRDYVEQVARALQAWKVRSFYDADEEIELWGKYLAEELPVIYGEQAAAVVVFVS